MKYDGLVLKFLSARFRNWKKLEEDGTSQDNGLWLPLHSFANIINFIYYEFQNDTAIA